MANGNTNPSRLGQIEAAGDDRALFLKVWANEVMATFKNKVIMLGKIRTKDARGAKSLQFPVYDDAISSFHVAGEDIGDAGNSYLSNILEDERLIFVDEPIVAAVFLSEIDVLMAQPDWTAEFTPLLGERIARTYDSFVLQKMVLTARAAATITGGDGGSVLAKGATVATNATVLIDAVSEAIKKLDEKNVPMDERFIIVRPEQYHLLLNDSTNNSNRFNLDRDIGSEGSFAKGKVGNMFGVPVIMSNQLPSTVVSAITGDKNTYSGTFTDTIALVAHKSCVGGVKVMDLRVMHEDQMATKLGHLITTAMITGFGTLRPESAVEITKA